MDIEYTEQEGDLYDIEGATAFGSVSRHGEGGPPRAVLPTDPTHP